MDILTQVSGTIALTMGVAWASGINLYAAIFMLGMLGATGHMVLPENLLILQDPLVLLAAGTMYLIEFFADKTPGVDSGWDAVHTFIRIPMGALLAAGAVGDVEPALMLAAALVGGGMAASTHSAKTGSRLLVNTSPEPVSNWVVSLGEDVMVVMGLWAALHYPIVFLVFLLAFIAFLIWFLPRVFKLIRALFHKVFGRTTVETMPAEPPSDS